MQNPYYLLSQMIQGDLSQVTRRDLHSITATLATIISNCRIITEAKENISLGQFKQALSYLEYAEEKFASQDEKQKSDDTVGLARTLGEHYHDDPLKRNPHITAAEFNRWQEDFVNPTSEILTDLSKKLTQQYSDYPKAEELQKTSKKWAHNFQSLNTLLSKYVLSKPDKNPQSIQPNPVLTRLMEDREH